MGVGVGVEQDAKKGKSLVVQGILWCGKQDLKRYRAENLEQPKRHKPLFYKGSEQLGTIWENLEKRQLHSQLHSNCIQTLAS